MKQEQSLHIFGLRRSSPSTWGDFLCGWAEWGPKDTPRPLTVTRHRGLSLLDVSENEVAGTLSQA